MGTNMVRNKSEGQTFPTWLVISTAVIARLAAFSFNLKDRPELNSPSQSYSQLSEERYAPNQSFIASSLRYFFDKSDLGWLFLLSLFDIISSLVISKKLFQHSELQPSFAWCLLNPISIVSTAGCSAGVISNTLIVCLWHCSINHKDIIGSLLLVLCSIDRLYPVQLLIPILLLKENMKRQLHYVGLCGIWTGILLVVSNLYGINVISNWSVIWKLTMYEPGLNSTWYMLIELFDHFRDFFVLILQIHAFCYVLPMCARYKPSIVIQYLIPLIGTLTPYATLSDFALLVCLLPGFPSGKRRLFGVLVLVTSLALCPVMWYLWIQLGSANANFYFATTLAVVAGALILLADALFAELILMNKCSQDVRIEPVK